MIERICENSSSLNFKKVSFSFTLVCLIPYLAYKIDLQNRLKILEICATRRCSVLIAVLAILWIDRII